MKEIPPGGSLFPIGVEPGYGLGHTLRGYYAKGVFVPVNTEQSRTSLGMSSWCLLTSLYVTQRMGPSFLLLAAVAILREQEIALQQISLIYLMGVFYGLKFLWAPLLDRIRLGRLGHYRGWLILTQFGMSITLLILGTAVPSAATFLFIVFMSLVLSIFSATQDIAIDALAFRLLKPEERGSANALQVGCALLGNFLGGGSVLILYPMLGWGGCMVFLTLCTLIPLVQLLLFHEPEYACPQKSECSEGLGIQRFLSAPGKRFWMLFIIVHSFGVTMVFALMTPILVDAGWALQRLGVMTNLIGPVVGLGAAGIAGVLLSRLSRGRLLVWSTFFQAFAVLPLFILLMGKSDVFSVSLFVGMLYFFQAPAAAVLSTIMMDHCSPQSPAVDYSLQSSVYVLVSFLASACGSFLAGVAGYFFVACFAVASILFAGGMAIYYVLSQRKILQEQPVVTAYSELFVLK